MIQPQEGSLLAAVCMATADGAIPGIALLDERLADVVRMLAAGADPNETDADGWSCLHMAVMGGQPRLIEILLEAGASTEGRLLGQDGGTPLALGLFYGKAAMLGMLATPPKPDNLRTAACLGRSVDRFFTTTGDLTDGAGAGRGFHRPLRAFPAWTPTADRQEILDEALTWSSRNGQVASMAALVERGADVNANPYRGTALLWAIYSDDVEAATWLLDHGADPDLRHDFGGAEHGTGATAMHLAAQYGSLATLRLLLARGADPTIKDGAFNSTPMGWAEHSGTAESLGVFAEFGGS